MAMKNFVFVTLMFVSLQRESFQSERYRYLMSKYNPPSPAHSPSTARNYKSQFNDDYLSNLQKLISENDTPAVVYAGTLTAVPNKSVPPQSSRYGRTASLTANRNAMPAAAAAAAAAPGVYRRTASPVKRGVTKPGPVYGTGMNPRAFRATTSPDFGGGLTLAAEPERPSVPVFNFFHGLASKPTTMTFVYGPNGLMPDSTNPLLPLRKSYSLNDKSGTSTLQNSSPDNQSGTTTSENSGNSPTMVGRSTAEVQALTGTLKNLIDVMRSEATKIGVDPSKSTDATSDQAGADPNSETYKGRATRQTLTDNRSASI